MGKVIPLTVQTAEIKTATVEIKTLTVSGKQVTLAVFRQLREEELISDSGTLNGTPWGVINYHPEKCGNDDEPHWHVVWQRENELLRARVDETPTFGGRLFHPLHGDALLCAIYRDAMAGTEHSISLLGHTPDFKWVDPPSYYEKGRPKTFEFELSIQTQFFSHSGCAGYCVFDTRLPERPYRTPSTAELKTHFSKIAAGKDVGALYESCMNAIKREVERRQRWCEATNEIAALPQLFIAV